MAQFVDDISKCIFFEEFFVFWTISLKFIPKEV